MTTSLHVNKVETLNHKCFIYSKFNHVVMTNYFMRILSDSRNYLEGTFETNNNDNILKSCRLLREQIRQSIKNERLSVSGRGNSDHILFQ